MYTIFKNDTSIFLTDKRKNSKGKNHFLWSDINQPDRLKELLSMSYSELYFYDKNLQKMWSEFGEHFKIIEASGGLVKNTDDQILFIFRNGYWDLPKGKIEDEESREEAALREVIEECGFNTLELGNFVGTTYHLYTERDLEVLKISYWYSMSSNQKDLTPQLEEGITSLKWVGESDLNLIKRNTFPNISLLLDMYFSVNQ